MKFSLWHIPFLAGTFLLSLVAAPAVLWFAGMGTGILLFTYFLSLVIAHIAALGIGFFIRLKTAKMIALLCGIACLPLISFGLIKLHDAWYVHFQAVYDRFRDDLVNPVPSSIAHLEFVQMQEEFENHLMFRFEIAPGDLDKIIHDKVFRKIGTDEFRRKDDLFTHQRYLPLPEPTSFYVREDSYGNGYTLKVSSDRRKVIFRKEDYNYYKYASWKSNPLIQKEEQNFIQGFSQTNHQ